MGFGYSALIEQIKRDHYRKSPVEYPILNDQYFAFLRNQNHPDASFSQVTIAQKRWGKTQLSMKGIDILMNSNKKRTLWMVDCEGLVNKIDPIFPGRVFNTHDIAAVPNNAILYFDETLVSLNGKRALTKFSRKIGEAFAFTSHKKIIVLGNAQTDGMIKDLRDKAEIVILGRLPMFFLEDARESFIRDLRDKLMTLPKEEAYVFANSFDFTARGRLLGDKRKWVPWFNDSISRNMANVSLDTDKQRKKKELKYMRSVIKEIEDVYSDKEILGSKLKKKIKGHFLMGSGLSEMGNNIDDRYIYLDEHNLWSDVESILITRADNRQRTQTKRKTNIALGITFKEDERFPEFVRRTLRHISNTVADMCYHWANGLSYRDIYTCLPDTSDHEINKTLKQFRSSGIDGQNDLRAGFLFEKWFAQQLDKAAGRSGGQSHEPDYIAADGRIYSLKCYSNYKKSLSFQQHKDFGPAYRLAKKQGRDYYAVLYNPKWDPPMRIRHLDPEADPDQVNFYKDQEVNLQ